MEQAGKIFPICSSYQPYIGDFTDAPFYWQSYNLFGFLANVRNYSGCPIIAPPRGLPEDWFFDELDCCFYGDPNQWVRGILRDFHSHSWLLLGEFLDFDYEQTFEETTELNERVGENTTWQQSNTWLQVLEIMDPNRKPKKRTVILEKTGKFVTYREHVGEEFFTILNVLKNWVSQIICE